MKFFKSIKVFCLALILVCLPLSGIAFGDEIDALVVDEVGDVTIQKTLSVGESISSNSLSVGESISSNSLSVGGGSNLYTQGGNVGVGTTNPEAVMHIKYNPNTITGLDGLMLENTNVSSKVRLTAASFLAHNICFMYI